MPKRNKKPGIRKQGISKRGSREDVFDAQFCKDVRKKLGLMKKDLPDSYIRKITDIQNREIASWVVNNPEGFKLKDMGVISVSKHLPKEFRDNKEETIDKIDYLEISEFRRKQILKRYDVTIDRRIDFNQLQEYQRLLPHVNMHSYFYNYKVMWFNQRNCKIKKATAYRFQAASAVNKSLQEKVLDGRDYYEWNFHDFYSHKISAKW